MLHQQQQYCLSAAHPQDIFSCLCRSHVSDLLACLADTAALGNQRVPRLLSAA